MLRRHRTPPPHSTPLPASLHSPHKISSHHAPGHSRPSRGTCWECRRGISAGRADGSRKLGRPRSRAGTDRTGRSPAGGRREVSSGRCHFVLHPTLCPVSGPYPSVDAHGVGDAVMLPSLTLVNVRANLGGRERRGHCPHAATPEPGASPVLCMLPLPSIPPQTPTIPNSDPSLHWLPSAGPHHLSLEARQGKGSGSS